MRSFQFAIFLLLLSVFHIDCGRQDVALSDYKVLGASANNILSGNNYDKLTIQFLGQDYYQPSKRVTDSVVAILSRYINKPKGITFINTPLPTTTKTTFTISEVAKFENTYRTVFTSGTNLAVCITILDKPFTDKDVLGDSYWNTSFAISKGAIDESYATASQYEKENILITLIIHEFGHLMGLVALGSPMVTPHKDADNASHCNSTNCIMYYEIEAGVLKSGIIPSFDEHCLADMRANGGK